jgi:capsid assembly protease
MLVDQSARVWAMRRDDVMASQALQFRAAVANGDVEAVAPGDLLEGSYFARVINGVAIIPVKGPLMRAFSWWAWSYEEIGRDLELAQASNLVRAIVLDIDSPGGLVAGCGDLAAVIRASGPKPVEAFVGGMAASAAYWLASSAARVRVGSGAILGSIGSVIEYVDFEPMFEKMGAKIVRVVAEQSPNKRLDPHGPEGQAELQALVDAAGAEFVAGVAANRGVTVAQVLDQFGQGLVYDGMEAIARGMADDRTTLEEMVAELAGRDQIVIAAPAAAAQETPMDWANIDLAALQQHRPDLVSAIETAASTTAAAAERNRILGLDEVAVEGFEEMVTAAKADGKTTPAELALQIVKADKKAGSTHLAQRAAAETAAAVAPVQPQVTQGDDTAPLDQRAKAKWDKDAALRAEFGDNFGAYLAFEQAAAAGTARILRAS